MRTAFTLTSADAYSAHKASGKAASQHAMILAHIKQHGGSWSIGEIASAMGWQKSTVSARINELMAGGQLEAKSTRKDRRSGVMVRPVGLPVVGQRGLF